LCFARAHVRRVPRACAMADIVTQLQDSVNEINGLFYNCAGVLQRDARPASTTNGELGDGLGAGGVDEKQIAEFASAVVSSSRKIDTLASALPEIELDLESQLARIKALQQQNDAVELELVAELRVADETLRRATAAFEATTNETLVSLDDPGDATTA
jgi:mediator of RNA polymerase II transcription subunit 21